MADIIVTEGALSRAQQMQTNRQDAYLELDPEIVDSTEFVDYLSRIPDRLSFDASGNDQEHRLKVVSTNMAEIITHYWDIECEPHDIDSVRAEIAEIFAE